jgi:hypothetical protein
MRWKDLAIRTAIVLFPLPPLPQIKNFIRPISLTVRRFDSR